MVRAEAPKLRPILKPISVGAGSSPPPTPSPLRVIFAAVARDAQTGAAVPPSPRTREQFYTSVKERQKEKRRERRAERIEEIRAELEAKKEKKKQQQEKDEEEEREKEKKERKKMIMKMKMKKQEEEKEAEKLMMMMMKKREEKLKKKEDEWRKKKMEEREVARKFAELEKLMREAHARARKFDRIVGFGLNEGWYSNMIECMRAVYCQGEWMACCAWMVFRSGKPRPVGGLLVPT
ncbi:uncharacterized protein F4812DRAFT_441711 [Daldinia caldariorum]|uniref:uncharacterized protein n=1 Tax=Daldinia caldariorum TaxID=326644 RepID=UPI0020080E69|nr:uncharacterized protein F4812DRAFT_441711 [Daldinia caldariorum]KAI1464717.1 hypothetical protein F4812DRAFT_441711 [Daldinia caldariorum]